MSSLICSQNIGSPSLSVGAHVPLWLTPGLLVLIQLILDAIDQGLPTRFDDVRRHAHCSPPVMLIPGLNQYPHRGSGPRVAPQDPNLIVEQFHLLQLGIELGERFAQGTVERVDRTVPLSCRV